MYVCGWAIAWGFVGVWGMSVRGFGAVACGRWLLVLVLVFGVVAVGVLGFRSSVVRVVEGVVEGVAVGVARVGGVVDGVVSGGGFGVWDGVWTVRVSGSGGGLTVDRCSGGFTLMSDYAVDGRVPPVVAAHNNCGGALVLGLRVGDRVRVVGGGELAGLYRVVGDRVLGAVGASTGGLVGVEGELLVQSCFWVGDRIRFVGLERVSGGG